jgi:hypothetical protein
MEYISEKTKQKIYDLVSAQFQLNRYFDRAMSVLDTKFAMNKFVLLAHPKLAHIYPLVADEYSDILIRWNYPVIYDTTYRDDTEYASPMEFFEGQLERHLLIYDLINESITVAIENKDTNVEVDLKHLLRQWNRFIGQSYLLRDKAKSANGNWAMFDGFSEQYVNLVFDPLEKVVGG